MSRLLLEWVNDEVQVSRRVASLGELRNGYLLGELLWRHNQESDFAQYRDSDKVQHKIDNFCRLEQSLARLGVQGLDASAALLIMEGEREDSDAVILGLLYKIKSALGGIKLEVGRHPGAAKAGGKFAALTNFVTLRKPVYEGQKSTIFRNSISVRTQSQNQVDMQRHVKPFFDEAERQAAFVERMQQKDREDTAMYYQEVRARRAMNKRAELQYLNDWHEKGIGLWTDNQRRRRYADGVTRRYASKVARRALEARQDQLACSQSDAQLGIAQMEQRCCVGAALEDAGAKEEEEGGADGWAVPPPRRASAEVEVDFEAASPATSSSGPEATSAPLPRGALEDQAAVHKTLSEIRERRELDPAAQSERERRRVKLLVGLQEETCEALDARRVKALQACMAAPCAGERRLAAQCEWQRRYVEVMRENRAAREQRKAEQARRDAAADEYRQSVEAMEHEDQVARQCTWYEQHAQQLAAASCKARLRDVTRDCRSLALVMVEAALAQVDLRVACGPAAGAPEAVLQEPVVRLLRGGTDAARAELDDYVSGDRLWSGAAPRSPAVGAALERVRVLAHPAPPAPAPAAVPRFPLQIALVGGPLCGRSTAAWRLAARFNLAVLEPTACVAALLEAFPERQRDVHEDQTVVDAVLLGIQRVAGNSARRLAALAQRKQVLAASFASSSATVAAATAAPAGAGGATHGADAVELLFQLWDADGSGDIDPAELLRATLVAHVEGKSRAEVEAEGRLAFAQLDLNLDGRIVREELRTYLQAVFGEQAPQVAADLLTRTDELCRPIEGWVLDGFPRTRSQARLLERALTALDADATEHQSPALRTVLRPAPAPLAPETFLGRGALDLAVDLSAPPGETWARAARLGLQLTDRARVAPQALAATASAASLHDWLARFGALQPLRGDPATDDQDALFAALEAPVAAILERKRKREESERIAEAKRAHRAAVLRVDREWALALSTAACAVEPDADAAVASAAPDAGEQSDEAAARRAVADVPPLDARTLVAAGLCAPGLAQPPASAERAEDGWYSDKLVLTPEEACAAAAAYRASDVGRLLAVSANLPRVWQQQGVQQVEETLTRALAEELPLRTGQPLVEQAPPAQELPERLLALLVKHAAASSASAVIDVLRAKSAEAFAARRKELEADEAKVKKGAKKPAAAAATATGAAAATPVAAGGPPAGAAETETEATSRWALAPDAVSLVSAAAERADSAFCEGAVEVFAQQSTLRAAWVNHFAGERGAVDALLRSGDAGAKQEKVEEFQAGVDALSDELRFHPATKGELLMRLDELARGAYALTQGRRMAAHKFVQSLRTAPWLPTYDAMQADCFLQLLQLEASRFQALRGALVLSATGEFASSQQAELYRTAVDVVELGAEAEAAQEAAAAAAAATASAAAAKKAKAPAPAKKGTEKPPAPDAEEPAPPSDGPDPRVERAAKKAVALADALRAADCPASALVADAIAALDAEFRDAVGRIAARANQEWAGNKAAAEATRLALDQRVSERFDHELQAIEALVLVASKRVEDARPLGPAKLKLDGASFLYA